MESDSRWESMLARVGEPYREVGRAIVATCEDARSLALMAGSLLVLCLLRANPDTLFENAKHVAKLGDVVKARADEILSVARKMGREED